MTLRSLGLWLHLLAIVVWVGGMVGWMLVLLTAGTTGGSDAEPPWIETLGRRIFTLGWEALLVLVLTGIFNLLPRVQSGRLLEPTYYTPLLIKLTLVAGMIGLQLWQHQWLMPRLGKGADRTERLHAARKYSVIASGIFVVLAAGALWIGVQLRF